MNLHVIAALTILAPNAWAGTDPGTLVRTNPLLRSAALQTVQFKLCTSYRSPIELSACLSAGRKLQNIISFSGVLSEAERVRLAKSFRVSLKKAKEIVITAIHTDRLDALLRDSRTVSYLRNITFYHRFDPSFNLWDASMSGSTSKLEALERIAVLFQDLSESREHLNWAKSQDLPAPSVDELVAANLELAGDLKLGVVGATEVNHLIHYPKVLSRRDPQSLSPGVYHFYSTANWVARLRQAGVSREHAILHAFGVHLAYELSSIKHNPYFWPAGLLPNQLDSDYKSRDLATAYWGAVYGAALTDPRPVPAPRPGLAKRLQTNFRVEVRNLLSK